MLVLIGEDGQLASVDTRETQPIGSAPLPPPTTPEAARRVRACIVAAAMVALSAPCVSAEPSDDVSLTIASQVDFAAARECQRLGWRYMLRQSPTKVILLHEISTTDVHYFKARLCDDVVLEGIEKIIHVRKANR